MERGVQVPWNRVPERVRAPWGAARSFEALLTSRVVWECSSKRVVNSI